MIESRPLSFTARDIVYRQWTATIDIVARRLKIVRQWLGLRPKSIVDCSFDECVALGTIRYNSEEFFSYAVYVELKNGKRHAIPGTHGSETEASKVAIELVAATGIPRSDTIYP